MNIIGITRYKYIFILEYSGISNWVFCSKIRRLAGREVKKKIIFEGNHHVFAFSRGK